MSSVTFHHVTAKNFRSVGNMPMTFNFEDAPNKLVVSTDNGIGKSTMTVHALEYVLFDKAYDKGCKKTSLVNSRSNKECVVEVEFTTRGSRYLVRRGMKPTVFDILKDGVRIEDEAALKDYQACLEGILGFDEKTFLNSVALGRDKFVPFIEMSLGDRRNYVEQMLDITVFSKMNEATKDNVKLVRRQVEQIQYEIGMARNKLESHRNVLVEFKNQVARAQGELRVEVDRHKVEAAELSELIETSIQHTLDAYAKCKEVNDQGFDNIARMSRLIIEAETKQRGFLSNAERIGSLTTCPTCSQDVCEEHKEAIRADAEEQASSLNGGLEKMRLMLQVVQERKAQHDALIVEVNQRKQQTETLKQRLAVANGSIERLQAMIEKAADPDKEATLEASIESAQKMLDVLAEKEKEAAMQERHHMSLLSLLKDDAVKAEIIRSYLPFLNQKINAYLDAMGLYVAVNLNEDFAVEMFAPDRKGQTVESLSTGQKCRINLAILLAWRELAQAKSSVDTNVLILDEVLENLSASGVVDFIELWKKVGHGVKLVVITQRNQEFAEHFDKVVKYTHKDDMLAEI